MGIRKKVDLIIFLVISALFFNCSDSFGASVPLFKREIKRNVTARRLPTRQYNSILGVEVVNGGAAFAIGGQLGFQVKKNSRLYIGPEVHMSRFNSGTMVKVLASMWYEIRIHGIPSLGFGFGALLGPAFATEVSQVARNPFVVLFEGIVSQDLTDLTTIRGQIRQGFIASEYVAMVNINVSFRFY